MSNLSFKIQNLSKAYRITRAYKGKTVGRYKTLQQDIISLPKNLWRKLQGKQNKDRETIWALKDISFDVIHGEAMGIIGRNGAGKSTLLKILSRITDPTEGRAEVYGRVGSLLEVGTGFHPELTGRENIFLNGAIIGMRRSEIISKFDNIVDFSEVGRYIDTPVKFYSSGMYVRLAFAVAAHLEPEILVVDEVLAVGDAEFQKKCLGKMGDVANEGRTVLFVSHNMGMISSLCKRAILLNSGNIIFDGNVSSAIAQYYNSGMSSPFSADFTKSKQKIGDQYATLIEGHIEDENGATTGEIDINSSFKVKMKYALHGSRSIPSVPNFHFNNAQGQCAFITSGTSEAYENTDGIYEATCFVPGSLLNNDIYFIDLALTFMKKGKHVSFWQKGALAVVIRDELDITIDKERHGFSGAIPGVIRPKLSWEVKKVS